MLIINLILKGMVDIFTLLFFFLFFKINEQKQNKNILASYQTVREPLDPSE